MQRPFEAHHHDKLEKEITRAQPRYPVTQPPISMPCLHAISSLLEKDVTKRIGASSFDSFVQSPFFQPIDFVALEKKRIAPIFVPSSEKTNFDATYDLEELLLEEAPLEARARRQKPRAQLKPDATDKEIRDDELHRMIETLFEPFDYTQAAFDPYVFPIPRSTDPCPSPGLLANRAPQNHPGRHRAAPADHRQRRQRRLGRPPQQLQVDRRRRRLAAPAR